MDAQTRGRDPVTRMVDNLVVVHGRATRTDWARNLRVVVALLLTLSVSATASAQDWARKLFKVHEHDFGTVARAAKVEYVFEIENIYEETLHIAGVRTSCGCTSASLMKDTLKTWEKGGVVATFNTASFLGHRNATITVTIDKPFYAEVQLNVQGYIRSDVVFAPGAVDFGSVDQGTPTQRKVSVTYAGRSNWQIVDVRCANSNFEVELSEAQRSNGRVTYDMIVHLKPEAPEGALQDQLVIVTNDPKSSTVPLAVEGRVVSPLTLSPASLFLGTLKPGQSVSKKLVVKAKQPFQVREVRCGDARFQIDVPSDSKSVHVIPITFTAGDDPEKVAATIEVVTDMNSATAKCQASATVTKPN